MSGCDSTHQNSSESISSYRKYQSHKKSAKYRGVDFDLTYDEWMAIWGQKLENRGRLSGQYGMLRTRDEGGYTVGNVRIGTPKENQQESAVAKKVQGAQLRKPFADYRPTPPNETAWMWRKGVFSEYSEDDEENA